MEYAVEILICGMRRIAAGLATALVCAATAFGQQSASAVYELIAPAVVFVETDGGTGSGLLLESNTVLTAAHVLYPHRSARIVFAHGAELLDVPVIGWDLMADIALLGPVEVDPLPALPRFDLTAALAIGADLFTVGYPGEVESFPQPTISRGILSRYRRWSEQGITYLQTDAALDGGQSGGMLASISGAVVGMTVFGGSFGHFGLALSMADVLPRVAALLAGEDPAQLGARGWDGEPQAAPIHFNLDNYWSVQAFVIAAEAGDEVSFSVRSRFDAAVEIVDASGISLAEADANEWGTESVTAMLEGPEPFLLLVKQFPEADEDDDSGGGLFGLNAELLFQAEVERTYRIVIDDPSGESGGYTLVVEPRDSASEQP